VGQVGRYLGRAGAENDAHAVYSGTIFSTVPELWLAM
jgi:hypothetical protein